MKDNCRWILDRRLCWVVLLTFTCLALWPANARAALIESRLTDGSVVSERIEMIDAIRTALEKDVVAQRLADYGLTPAEISTKLPTMTDEQLHQLASLSDSLGEGGDALGAVIAVLLIILLVVVILKITDREITVH